MPRPHRGSRIGYGARRRPTRTIKMTSLRVMVGYIGKNCRHSDNKAMERPTHRRDNNMSTSCAGVALGQPFYPR